MSKPVYKIYFVKKTEIAFQLSPEDEEALLTKVHASLESVGGERVISLDVSNEKWQWFGLEKYPSLEAVQEHNKNLDELNWWRYSEAETMLGF